MLNGYRLMGVEENQKYKGKNVFYFMDSEKIRKCIQTYFGNSKQAQEVQTMNTKIENCNTELLEQQKQQLEYEIVHGENAGHFAVFDIEAGC